MLLGLFARIRLWQDVAMSLRAGMRVEDALAHAAGGRGTGAGLARALRDTGRSSLAEAVAACSGRFSSLELAVVQAAEMAGRLPETLAALAEYLKKKRDEISSLLMKLAYPVVIVHLAAVVGMIARNAFAARGGGSGGGLASVLFVLLPFYLVTFLLFLLPRGIRFLGPAAAEGVDRFLNKLPFVGSFFREEALCEFYWLMGTLLKSGVPVREAISFAAGRVSNFALRYDLNKVKEAVKQGEPLGEWLGRTGVIPANASALLTTGEETGNLAEAFDTVFDESQRRRAMAGRGVSAALWALYFFMAGLYVLWAFWGVIGGETGMFEGM